MIVLVGTLLATWCGGGGISGSAGLVYKNGPLFGILLFAGAPIGMIVLYFISGAVREKVPHILFRSCLSCAAGSCQKSGCNLHYSGDYIGTTASQFKAAGIIFMITSGIDFITSTVICVIFMALLGSDRAVWSAWHIRMLYLLYDGVWLHVRHFISERDFRWLYGVLAQVPAEKNSIFGTMNIAQVLGYVRTNRCFGAG